MENTSIGIDRIVLSMDMKEQRINREILSNIDAIVMQGNNKHSYRIMIDEDDQHLIINYIKIDKTKVDDIKFNSFTVGNKTTGGGIIPYNILDATLPKLLSGTSTNEKNISNTQDLEIVLKILEDQLEALGFGEIDLSKANIIEIEINTNIKLDAEFKEYEGALEYLRGLRRKDLRKLGSRGYEKQGQYTGWYDGNGSVVIKMYNKKEDIKTRDKVEIGQELLRMEYKLLSGRKVKDTLGHNVVKDLLDDQGFKGMQEAFKEMLYKDMIQRVEKNINIQVDHAVKHIKKYVEIGGGSSAIDEYLKNHQANLLDIEVILEALRQVIRPANYARECRKAIKSTGKIEGKKLFGNINKLNEILIKLDYDPIKMDMTPVVKKEVEKHY